jgi:hypothetical protein
MDQLASKEVVDHILSHHGIKGMKWGVRRSRGSSSEVTVKTSSHSQTKTSIRTKGGKGLPAHPDAVAARVIQQKLNKSGSHALSNVELSKLNTRLNLEQQVNRLAPGSGYQKAAKTVSNLLSSPHGKMAIKAAQAATSSGKIKTALKVASAVA